MKHSTLLILIVLGMCACGKQESVREVPPVEVSVQVMEAMTTCSEHTYMGELEDRKILSISSLAGGKVTEVLVHNNNRVRKDQPLVRIDDTQVQNSLRSARATLRQAEDGYRRVKQMYNNNGVPEVKLIEIETQLNQARAMVAIAEKELRNCTVTAPQDGTITNLDCKEGQTVVPGAALMRLISDDGLSVSISVPESEVMKLKIGDKGEAIVAVLGDTKIPCEISEMSLIPNRMSHTYTIRMALENDIPQSARGRLLPGMVCRVLLANESRTGYLLPSDCLQMHVDELYVWVVNDGKATRRKVSDVLYQRNAVLVNKGIQQGDTIVVSGFQKLYSGAVIHVSEP